MPTQETRSARFSRASLRSIVDTSSGVPGRYVATLAVLVGLVWLIPPVGSVVFVGLVIWAVRGDKQAVQALTVAWLLSALNPEIYSGSPSALRWLVLVAATGGAIVRMGPTLFARSMRRYSGLLLFVALTIPSMILAVYPALAVSKLIGFLVGAVGVIVLFFSSRRLEREWTTSWFLALFWTVTLLSVPLLASPMGYVRNERGFQGILNHPQALGVFLAPYVAFLVLAWITRHRGPFLGSAALLGGVMLVLTQSRAGVVAALFGVAVGMLFVITGRSVTSPQLDHRRGRIALVVGLLLIVVGAAAGWPQEVSDFVMKRADTAGAVSLVETWGDSRGGLVSASFTRIAESPLFGHGFGVPADVDPSRIQKALGTIPIGAPVESGFALTGIAEQVGLVGLAAFLVFLVQLVRPIFRSRDGVAVGLIVATLSTNIGEATIISFGGIGLIVWLMIGWAGSMTSPAAPGQRTGRSHSLQHYADR